MENKNLFTIPLFSWYYVAITLIFILMKFLEMIDWSPLWIISPLWIPSAIAFSIMLIIYFLRLIVFLIELITFKNFRI